MKNDNPLEHLGKKYNPTKRQHGYLPLYWQHFRDMRERATRVCEIGVQSGDSLRMWEEFFPNAEIWGVDIDPSCKRHDSGRVKILIGSQGDKEFLRDTPSGFDVIIDDGSHMASHQILSLRVLFPKLKDGGIYVIEDMIDPDSPVYFFLRHLVTNINFWPNGVDYRDWPRVNSFPENSSATWWDRNLVGVAFYRYIAFLTKGRNPEDGAASVRLSEQSEAELSGSAALVTNAVRESQRVTLANLERRLKSRYQNAKMTLKSLLLQG